MDTKQSELLHDKLREYFGFTSFKGNQETPNTTIAVSKTNSCAETIHRDPAINHILQTRLCKINKYAFIFEFFAFVFYIMYVILNL